MLSTPSSSARRQAARNSWMVHCCGWMVTPTLNGLSDFNAVRLSKRDGWGVGPGPSGPRERGPGFLEAVSRAAPRAAERIASGRSRAARRRARNPHEERQPVRVSALLRDLARRRDAQLALR